MPGPGRPREKAISRQSGFRIFNLFKKGFSPKRACPGLGLPARFSARRDLRIGAGSEPAVGPTPGRFSGIARTPLQAFSTKKTQSVTRQK